MNPPKKKVIEKPSGQLTLSDFLKRSERRATLRGKVIDDEQDELHGKFVFEDDEGISAFLDDMDADPMYEPSEDTDGLEAMLQDMESDEMLDSVSFEASVDGAASPPPSAGPSNGPTPTVATEGSTDDPGGAVPPTEVLVEQLVHSDNSSSPVSPGPTADASSGPQASAEGPADTELPNRPIYIDHKWPLPPYLKEYHERPRHTYKLKPIFTPTNLNRIQGKYRYAVYKHRGDTKAQNRAVLSVCYHECDHNDATVSQKDWYHRY